MLCERQPRTFDGSGVIPRGVISRSRGEPRSSGAVLGTLRWTPGEMLPHPLLLPSKFRVDTEGWGLLRCVPDTFPQHAQVKPGALCDFEFSGVAEQGKGCTEGSAQDLVTSPPELLPHPLVSPTPCSARKIQNDAGD